MTRHPVDSTTRSCCGGIGGHTQDCNPVARMTPGEQATYRRLTRRYGRDGIVRALTADFTDHSRPGCCPVGGAHAGDSHAPGWRAQAGPDLGDVHIADVDAGPATKPRK